MAVTASLYGKFLQHLLKGDIDADTQTFKVMLTTSTYVPNIDTHEFRSSVTNEVTGTGYTAGGKTLTGVTTSYDATGNRGLLDAADVVWTTATFTVRYAVIYVSIGTAATDILVGWIDFGADQSPSSSDFTIVWNSAGIAAITAA